MEKRHDIKGILFNFSGTIDTEGSDWFDLIWKEYREIGIPITKSDYLAAHEFAEKEISEKGLIEPWFNFYFTYRFKSNILFQKDYYPTIDVLKSMPNNWPRFVITWRSCM